MRKTSEAAAAAVAEATGGESRRLIFVYGTLKRGFPNHPLLEDLMVSGDACFIGGQYRTLESFPLVCGPFQVPFLLNLPGFGDRVGGELYSVSDRGLSRIDDLEGTIAGHYERLPIEVTDTSVEGPAERAETYFGHRSYAEEMWRRSGERGHACYSEEEASGYVRRKDRPADSSFLDQIRIFVSSLPDSDPRSH